MSKEKLSQDDIEFVMINFKRLTSNKLFFVGCGLTVFARLKSTNDIVIDFFKGFDEYKFKTIEGITEETKNLLVKEIKKSIVELKRIIYKEQSKLNEEIFNFLSK